MSDDPGTGLLITGVSGYVGRVLGYLAAEHGVWPEIVGTFCNHPLELPGVESVRLDLRNRSEVEHLIQSFRPRAVIHTAIGYEANLRPVIVNGTGHLAQAVVRNGARLVHVSTDVVLDGEHAPYADDAPPAPLHDYGRAKAEAEAEVIRPGGDWLIVRTSLIYGFDPPDRQLTWLLKGPLEGQPVYLFTDEFRQPIWVANLAEALLELAGNEVRGYLNVAGSQVVNRYDYGLKLLAHLGIEPKQVFPGLNRASGLLRPRDLRLRLDRARAVLRTTLLGVDEALRRI